MYFISITARPKENSTLFSISERWIHPTPTERSAGQNTNWTTQRYDTNIWTNGLYPVQFSVDLSSKWGNNLYLFSIFSPSYAIFSLPFIIFPFSFLGFCRWSTFLVGSTAAHLNYLALLLLNKPQAQRTSLPVQQEKSYQIAAQSNAQIQSPPWALCTEPFTDLNRCHLCD